jgi:hypothetical protein
VRRLAVPTLSPLLAVLLALGLGACGRGQLRALSHHNGSSTTTPQAQVQITVERFATAVARRDYATVCALLSAGLLSHLENVGLPCSVAMSQGLGAVVAPQLTLTRVTVKGQHAVAFVHTVASGQSPSDDQLQLVREPAGWRLASLAG